MIGHQAESEEAHGRAFAGLVQQANEGGEVAVFVEDGAATVAAIEDVVTVAALGGSCGAWHAVIIANGAITAREIYDVPFSGPPRRTAGERGAYPRRCVKAKPQPEESCLQLGPRQKL